MQRESVDSFIVSLNWGEELKKAEAQADKRLSYFRKDECNSKGQVGHDIAVAIISRILENPDILKDSDLTLRNFRARIRGEINNAVKLIVKSKEADVTHSYNRFDILSDEDFYDEMLLNQSTGKFDYSDKPLMTSYFEKLSNDLLDKSDDEAWLILEELRDGKKPQEISINNNIPISKVYSSIKRIYRAGRLIERSLLHA